MNSWRVRWGGGLVGHQSKWKHHQKTKTEGRAFYHSLFFWHFHSEIVTEWSTFQHQPQLKSHKNLMLVVKVVTAAPNTPPADNHPRRYRYHLRFCCCLVVSYRLLLYCGSELWLNVHAAGWASPGRSHLSLQEQWMTPVYRCIPDRTLCHLSSCQAGEPEDERTRAEVRFRASPP